MINSLYPFNESNSSFTGSVIDYDGDIVYYISGKISREDGPALLRPNGYYSWDYNGNHYGSNNSLYGDNEDFTIEEWKEKVGELKRLESLEIFK